MHGGGGQPRAGVYRPGHAAGCNAALQRPARPGVTRFAGMWAECLLARARPDPSARPPDRPGRPIEAWRRCNAALRYPGAVGHAA